MQTAINLIDGPMLPQLSQLPRISQTQLPTHKRSESMPTPTATLVPIITPPIAVNAPQPSTHVNDDGDESVNDDHDGRGEQQQYLLVPNPRNIVVRSMHHGRRVCILVPPASGEALIQSVSLSWLPNSDGSGGEWVILAGGSDGIIHEWSASSLSLLSPEDNGDNGDDGSKEGRKPRRSFHLTDKHNKDKGRFRSDWKVIHMASPSVNTSAIMSEEESLNMLSNSTLSRVDGADGTGDGRNGAVVYALVEGSGKHDGAKEWLVRCAIPPFDNGTHTQKPIVNHALVIEKLVSVLLVSKKTQAKEEKKHICLRKKDTVFGLSAAYRPCLSQSLYDGMEYMTGNSTGIRNGKGEVFVVVCASSRFAIYRETVHEFEKEEEVSLEAKLVHFTQNKPVGGSMESSGGTKDVSFSTLAISPDIRDLALGRANGHIELLDNIFDNVSEYLSKIQARKASSQTEFSSQLRQPEDITVRRTIHWHAHPVRALTFLTPHGTTRTTGGMGSFGGATLTKSLLSGGEESVLVTWQLDRNYHRPSHFVARVGQGGILHASCCGYSGKIVVACADNSLQCLSGSNYERDWVEFGLASAPLHWEEGLDEEEGSEMGQKRRSPNIGGVIMLKDPITNFPMLTNLPGAPGMVHWYDPKSASVVGTLEVSPYNRVSRRDPLNDPHIPAPSVTHIALGENGRDLVTVDIVWTENTSVGSRYDLFHPQKNIPIHMNVCTSIKFWTYLDSPKTGKAEGRKRRNGEVPMNYGLVSSMAAPHGREGEICALAMDPSGGTACTLSREEDAFRIWKKNTASISDAVTSTLWKCHYKVKSPSGYSNLLSNAGILSNGERLVTFSSDGTVLSVAYGGIVTLWDHSSATLLTSVTLDGCKGESKTKEDVKEVHFLGKHDSSMVISTQSIVGVKSPFGGFNKPCYMGGDEWSLNMDCFGEEARVSSVVPLSDFELGKESGEFFAVSVVVDSGKKSIVSILNRSDGKVVCENGSNNPIQWTVQGEVHSLCIDRSVGSSVQMLAITKDYQIFSLTHGKKYASIETTSVQMRKQAPVDARANAPQLKLPIAKIDTASVKRRKISIGGISRGQEKVGDFSGFEFPALSGKFTSAFIARSFGK